MTVLCGIESALAQDVPVTASQLVPVGSFGPQDSSLFDTPQHQQEASVSIAHLVDSLVAKSVVQEDMTESTQAAIESAEVTRGRAAFESSCTICHDADRSLEKAKSYSAWVNTVRRMASKSGADIPSSDIVPIARYLASLSQSPTTETSAVDTATSGVATSPWSLNATVAPLWRGTNDEQRLENPGFFVDAWLGATWQSEGAISVTATICTSCHSFRNPSAGFALEFVEAAVSVDVNKLRGIDGDACFLGGMWSANIKAGRFVVPFGAFSVMSNPSLQRTVTNPLMFNMGRRLGVAQFQPVLPGPYADEGVDLTLRGRFCDQLTATLDVFAVNGLQFGGLGTNFSLSRQYVDNNREPAVGLRTTVGTNSLRLGGSLMSGTAQNDGNPQFNYRLAGVDAVLRVREAVRFYFEYAIRTEDSLFVPGDQNHTYGIVTQLEVGIPRTQNLSMVVRYDTLEHRDAFFADGTQERVTWGFNKGFGNGSLLMINHEHWMLAPDDADVIAVRCSTTY